MIDNKLVRKLHCKLMKINGESRLLLFMSNYSTCGLATLDVNTTFQPIMKHGLIHLNVPYDTGRMFPNFDTSELLITGAQIVPGSFSNSNNSNDFFTVFLNLNNGDIWAQDFFVTDEDYVHPGRDMHESSFHQNPYQVNFSEETLEYLEDANKFLRSLKFRNPQPFPNPAPIEENLFNEEVSLTQSEETITLKSKKHAPTLKFTIDDPVDFGAMLKLWKTNNELRKNFRDLTCKLTDKFVESLEKMSLQSKNDDDDAESSGSEPEIQYEFP